MYLHTLTSTCKKLHDVIYIRFPIHKNLLEMILFDLERMFSDQPYLEYMFKAFFILSYYDLFRPGELASGPHSVLASNVHIAKNKQKMMFILYTSKNHGFESRPQKIKITAVNNKAAILNRAVDLVSQQQNCYFCPFKISCEYLAIRGNLKMTLTHSLCWVISQHSSLQAVLEIPWRIHYKDSTWTQLCTICTA